MSGRLVDLSQPNVAIPDPVVVDTNVVVAFALAAYHQVPRQAAQATALFQHLVNANQLALLTPTAFSEFLHAAIMARYKQVFRQRGRAALAHHFGAPVRDARELYKRDPSILQLYATTLDQLCQSLAGNNVVLLDPDQLGPVRTGRAHHRQLLNLVGRYGLDSSDASILLEAHRLGISAVVSMDRDMQRALADFDVYTWL